MGASLWNVGGGVLSLSVVVSLGGGVDIVGGGRGVSLGRNWPGFVNFWF